MYALESPPQKSTLLKQSFIPSSLIEESPLIPDEAIQLSIERTEMMFSSVYWVVGNDHAPQIRTHDLKFHLTISTYVPYSLQGSVQQLSKKRMLGSYVRDPTIDCVTP